MLLELVNRILSASLVDLVIGEVDDTQEGYFGATVEQGHHGIIGEDVEGEVQVGHMRYHFEDLTQAFITKLVLYKFQPLHFLDGLEVKQDVVDLHIAERVAC